MMAACSISVEALSLDIVGVLRKLQSLGFFLDLEICAKGPVKLRGEELRSVFDRILALFFTEINVWKEIPPLPALLGDGRSVDLFKLYLVVRGKGGYDLVSAGRLWASVASEIGLDLDVRSSLKLIYVKYLDALDRWLRIVLEERTARELAGGPNDLDLLVGVVKKEVNGFLGESPSHKKIEFACTPPSGVKRDQFLTQVRRNGRVSELDESSSGKEEDALVLGRDATNGKFSLKRKRDDLVGMLNWVKWVAKNPRDLSLFKNGENYQAHAIGELVSRVFSARKEMFIKKIPRIQIDGPPTRKGQETHPCAYADSHRAGNQSNEKTSCSKRLQYVTKQTDSGPLLESHTLDDKRDKGQVADADGNNGKQRLPKDKLHLRIPVGRAFQAKVPKWTGKPPESSFDSDSLKWLGTRTWPPENQVNNPSPGKDPVGKGRQETCECNHPGSVECVRFHVAEKRFHLVRELGSAFRSWRMDDMGEEASLSWTEEEQRTFKTIVRLKPPSHGKKFWEKLRSSFPQKGKSDLVSYYFNVFLLSRSCYQSRVTPNRVESDDEETEYDFVSRPYGQDAVSVCESKNELCVQNSQCMDFDEDENGD